MHAVSEEEFYRSEIVTIFHNLDDLESKTGLQLLSLYFVRTRMRPCCPQTAFFYLTMPPPHLPSFLRKTTQLQSKITDFMRQISSQDFSETDTSDRLVVTARRECTSADRAGTPADRAGTRHDFNRIAACTTLWVPMGESDPDGKMGLG